MPTSKPLLLGARETVVARPTATGMLIRPLGPQDAAALGRLFAGLRHDPASVHFHPHSFTRDQARRIAGRRGIREDLYFGAFLGSDLIGYGMLRGWDEGYAIPSFGVAVDVGYRNLGAGRKLLRHAISLVREHGAERMMLKVHPANVHAQQLYESEGFVFDASPMEDGQLRGLLVLWIDPRANV